MLVKLELKGSGFELNFQWMLRSHPQSTFKLRVCFVSIILWAEFSMLKSVVSVCALDGFIVLVSLV